jgi:release factor glutamine methyltransferase
MEFLIVSNISEIKLEIRNILQTQLNLEASEAEAESNFIIENTLGLNFTEQVLQFDKVVDEKSINRIFKIIAGRLERIPLQHLLGKAYFMGLEIQVNDQVLIPRPETETLVEIAIEIAKDKLQNVPELSILEIGTGSGCISIGLATYLSAIRTADSIKIWATDISEKALEVARQNIKIHNLQESIQVVHCDLVNEELLAKKFDLVISNPPYIASGEYYALEQEVKKEPYLALIGDKENKDGLLYYQGIEALNIQTTYILLELDPARANAIQELFAKDKIVGKNMTKNIAQIENHSIENSHEQTKLLKDLNGMIRFLLVDKTHLRSIEH